jgi:hypothetical protein
MGNSRSADGREATPPGHGSVLMDVNTGVVRRDRLLVQKTPTADLFIAFGPRAVRLHRFIFNDDGDPHPFIAACRSLDKVIESGDLAKAHTLGRPWSEALSW